jgi:prepilin-type N-terminal cleavage/methylation domain-containing protein
MKSSGFTLLELFLALGILAILLAFGIPLYKKFTLRKALQNSSVILERAIQERKQRAAAIGDWAGLCIQKQGLIDSYVFNPFSGTAAQKRMVNLSSSFGISLDITVSHLYSSYPCGPSEINIPLSPDPNFMNDWSGTVSLQSGGMTWHIVKKGDLLTNGP